MTDYLILGGGLAGCVLATRLKEYLPDARVTLVEAGPNEENNPLLCEPLGTMQLHNSIYQYNYKTVPQKHYNGREVFYAGGKVLSGSSSVNYAAWTRGDKACYDLWSKTVGDDRWSYDKQLPYFRKIETHHDASGDKIQHGFNGPIHTTPALNRTYPLTDKVRQAYLEIGVRSNDDHNSGNNKGLAPHIENWRNGKRQAAGKAYGLAGVELLTDSIVKRIILEKTANGGIRASGAELTSGQIIKANKEVILACGAIRSPQLLMLSGIGSSKQLAEYNIPLLVESSDVGQNFHEHLAITQFFKINNPENGYCAPHPSFNHPSYVEGFPTDYLVTESAPTEIVKAALKADGESVNDQHPHIYPPRSHYELLPMYAPTEVPLTNMNIPFDGSILSVGIINLLPTSRGSVTINSTDPAADPVIDPNYFATETDKAILRSAIRRNLSAFETKHGKAVVAHEIPPENFPELTSKSTDEEIDARVRRCAGTFFHGAGTAAMGKVVDSQCKVIGLEGLRVVDGSVLPVPISAHYMVPVYALAEQMADIIAKR